MTTDPHANGHADRDGAGDRTTPEPKREPEREPEREPDREPERPAVAGTLDTPEARELATLAETFGDLQYVLLCCEHLVAALGARPGSARGPADEALVEALWTGALVGYARCFSPRTGVLTAGDVTALGLEGDVLRFHDAVKRLRDHYVSRHVNPREKLTVGVVLDGDQAAGIAVLADPRPAVDDPTVRMLGRIAYALSTVVDGRIGARQAEVMAAAAALPGPQLSRLPQVRMPVSGGAAAG
jgi:hypothetical protein